MAEERNSRFLQATLETILAIKSWGDVLTSAPCQERYSPQAQGHQALARSNEEEQVESPSAWGGGENAPGKQGKQPRLRRPP